MDATPKSHVGDDLEPTPDELDFISVLSTCELLELAGRGDFSSEALVNAMIYIEKRCRDTNRKPLSKKYRDRMLAAIVSVEQAAIDSLPDFYDRACIVSGFNALANQIALCAEPSSRTAKRSQDHVKDVFAYARIFRNNIHNITISNQICARAVRAHERRETQIVQLRRMAGSKAA